MRVSLSTFVVLLFVLWSASAALADSGGSNASTMSPYPHFTIEGYLAMKEKQKETQAAIDPDHKLVAVPVPQVVQASYQQSVVNSQSTAPPQNFPQCGETDSGSHLGESPSCQECGECRNAESCCDCCLCGPPGDCWIRDEYVGWWMQGGRVPALVVTAPNLNPPLDVTPLYGDATYNGGYRSGNWLQAGHWFDCGHTEAVVGDFFFVGTQSSPYFISSDGDPILLRPFTDANTGLPSFEIDAVPGIAVGSKSISNFNSLCGAGIGMQRNLCCSCGCCDSCCKSDCDSCFHGQNCCRLDFTYGFRYYGFNDNLDIDERLTSISQSSPIAVGTQFHLTDTFHTQSNFYGGELGLIGQRYYGRWMLEGTAKVAVGAMQQLVSINGSTVVSFPGQPTVVHEGGLLALSSNIGNYSQTSFAAIPQLSLRLGFRATERLTLLAGYTFMFFSEIARAADQIDTTVNPTLIPPGPPVGPLRPAFNFHASDMWLQGVTLGAEYHF